MPLFQISLKNLSEHKTTQSTFWDGRVHFSRQPFSKKLYIIILIVLSALIYKFSQGLCL